MLYLVAVGVPLTLLITGAFARKLVNARPFEVSDFFLGMELTLSAFASGLIFLTENQISPAAKPSSLSLPVFLVVCFCLLLAIMSRHQDLERQPQAYGRQVFWLGFFANGIGIGLLATFIIYVKGIV